MPLNILTDRLSLQLATPADINEIHYLHSFPEVDRFNTTGIPDSIEAVSYTHLRAHETDSYLVCRLLLEKTRVPVALYCCDAVAT